MIDADFAAWLNLLGYIFLLIGIIMVSRIAYQRGAKWILILLQKSLRFQARG